MFYDENKHTALIAMYIFLYVNRYQIVIDKKILITIIMDMAMANLHCLEIIE